MDVTGERRDVLTVAEDLLDRWHRRPDGHASPREDPDRFEAWDELRAEVAEFLASRRTADLTASELARIERSLQRPGLHPLDAAHAVAWGLDDARHADLTDLWTRRIATVGARELKSGDLVAVTDAPDWALPAGAGFSSRPNSYKVAHDDLPHLRRFRSADVRVRVDASLDAPLSAVLETLRSTGFATVHPNAESGELRSKPGAPHAWPTEPRDPVRQLAAVRAGVGVAAEAGLVVLPELTVTAELVEALQAELEGGGAGFEDRLIVAGSAHEEREMQPHNVGYLMVPGAGPAREYRKNHAWRDDKAKKLEGIRPTEPPLVTVYTAGRYRFAALICLDLLDPHIVHTLGHLGVTLVAAPALSPKTDGFVSAAHTLVKEAQTVVVVANGPLSTTGELVVHSRPVATGGQGHPVRQPVVTFPDQAPRPTSPGVYRHSLASGTGQWVASEGADPGPISMTGS